MFYKYQALPVVDDDSDDIYIRLVVLAPGPKTGPITCSVITTLLSQAPDFETVSYCWRPPDHDEEIYVTSTNEPETPSQGATLKIPASLIPFLYRTRALGRVRTLWIDCICINQSDDLEKTIQVPKMRDVYSKAFRTLCWLGPEGDNSTAGFETAQSLHKLLRRQQANLGALTLSEEEQNEKINLNIQVGDPGLEGLFNLLQRKYLKRAWIVQEAVVSGEAHAICGDATIELPVFVGAFVFLILEHGWLFEFYPGISIDLILCLQLTHMDWQAGRDLSWWRMLLRHRAYLATDPRDKVYAFYGLTCRNDLQSLGIEPEYKHTTTQELYTKLAARAISTGCSEVLCVSRLVTQGLDATEEIQELDIPSWVPDWRSTSRTPQSLLGGEGQSDESDPFSNPDYHATGDSKLHASFEIPYSWPDTSNQNSNALPKLLKLRGMRLARITLLTPRPWYHHIPPQRQTVIDQARLARTVQTQTREWLNTLGATSRSQIYVPTGETVVNAMYETAMAGTTTATPEEKEIAVKAFARRQAFIGLLFTLHVNSYLIFFYLIALMDRILLVLFGRKNSEMPFRLLVGHMNFRSGARLMGSSKNVDVEYFALVPGIAQLGDQAVLIEGCKMPLVLRPKGEADVPVEDNEGVKKRVQTWELIGDAYIHGVMKGDVWDEGKVACEDFWIA